MQLHQECGRTSNLSDESHRVHAGIKTDKDTGLRLLLKTMVSLPPPPATEEALVTTAEKTSESPSAPPETELVTRSAPVVKTSVSAPDPPKIVVLVAATERVNVSLSAPKSMVLLETTPFRDHAVAAGSTVRLQQQQVWTGEQEKV